MMRKSTIVGWITSTRSIISRTTSRRVFFEFANVNMLFLASSVSKMSPEQIAELLHILADELSKSQPRVFKREHPGIVPVEPIRDFPHLPIRDRGCWNPRGYDRCISGCDDDEWCVDRCKMIHCRHY